MLKCYMMAIKPLTHDEIANTEKKLDMPLDDIVKMSKSTAKPKKQQRAPIKNQKMFNNPAHEKALKMQRYMNSRPLVRQAALAQRRSNFQRNQFPLTSEAARKAAVARFHNRSFGRNFMANANNARAGGFTVQRRAANGGFAMKSPPRPNQQQQQGDGGAKQRPQTLDSLFANMKEQRMKVFSRQNKVVQHNGGGRWPREKREMTVNLGSSSCLSLLFSHSPPPPLPKLFPKPNYTTTATLISLVFSFNKTTPFLSTSRTPSLKPLPFSLSQSDNEIVDNTNSVLSLNEESLSRVSAAKDANEALQIIAEITNRSNGLVSVTDCCGIITAAIDRRNADLALSVFYAMRSSFDQGDAEIERWKWSRPDVSVYTSLVQGLAAALKVSDALKMIDYICRIGVSPSEEVPFGKVVRCPTCMIAVAVAQPQYGIQIASCAKCRYQYELVSGDITSIDSEAIRLYGVDLGIFTFSKELLLPNAAWIFQLGKGG
ncbi:hypothetical protein NC651_008989 [Populus alba x Populus x berolinensis]|nr:hypothetical protein NC651_008989 [Populus alba x Populus x berolinensis]